MNRPRAEEEERRAQKEPKKRACIQTGESSPAELLSKSKKKAVVFFGIFRMTERKGMAFGASLRTQHEEGVRCSLTPRTCTLRDRIEKGEGRCHVRAPLVSSG